MCQIKCFVVSDIFQNFRKLYYENSLSHLSHHIGVPGLPRNTMLKMADVKLEPVLGFAMNLMVEKGIRGGILYTANSHSQGNNLLMNGSDENNKTESDK